MGVDDKGLATFSLVVRCPGNQFHLKMDKHGDLENQGFAFI
jgi:hypothetical protein